jgi:hypothetical protein
MSQPDISEGIEVWQRAGKFAAPQSGTESDAESLSGDVATIGAAMSSHRQDAARLHVEQVFVGKFRTLLNEFEAGLRFDAHQTLD